MRIIRRRLLKSGVRCIVEDDMHKNFHYEIPECWLSKTPQLPKAMVNTSIYISLVALDNMVQMILTKQQIRRAEEDVQIQNNANCAYLGSDTHEEQRSDQSDDLLPSTQSEWRE